MRKTLSDQIRRAIESSGLTRYRIAVESSAEESTLSRFMSGSSSLRTDTLDRIAEVLRLRVECDGPRATLLKRVNKKGKAR